MSVSVPVERTGSSRGDMGDRGNMDDRGDMGERGGR